MRVIGISRFVALVAPVVAVEGLRLLTSAEPDSTSVPLEDSQLARNLKCPTYENSLQDSATTKLASCNQGVMNIPFNSRTYFYNDKTMFTEGDASCDAGGPRDSEECTSYTKGAFFLSGKVLEYDIDLSGTECGCNAAMYFAGMPTNDEASTCGDHYCDANGICGTICTEIDVMEANTVAWKTVIHHKFDRDGEQYGWGRWMLDERSFVLLEGNGQLDYECLYGPSAECAINTKQIFHASFVFADTSAGEEFSFQTILTQEDRTIIAASIQYTEPTPDGFGQELSEVLSNQRLATSVEEGLTLVVSYWGGPNVDSLEWFDVPCEEAGCRDVYTGQSWPWICSGSGRTNCNKGYRLSNVRLSSTADFDPNAGVRAIGYTTFFVAEFNPISEEVEVDTTTMRYRFAHVLSNPEAFLWTAPNNIAEWVLVVMYFLGTFILNLYSMVRLNNILRAIWATRFFRAKPKTGGVIAEGEEPVVTLQICCYNERNVIKNTINAACAVDWPRSKLVVQVLDDSTDESIEIIEQTCARLRELGFNCHRLQRSDRIGYKAGNLQSHFDDIKGEFVGLFDSDHLCEGDFLKKCVPHFFDEKGRPKPKVGLVQCPWGYYNIHKSLLTEYDALNLDTSFVIDQTARDAFLGAFSFNGTGGLWRKQAIADVGGWSWETVTEDLYISYQAAMAGYKFVYLRDLPQVLEVPANIRAHLLQKNRWTKGYWQVARKTLWTILRNRKTPFLMKLEIFFQYTASIMYAWTLLLVLLSPILTYLKLYSPLMICLSLLPATIALIAGVVTVFGKDAGNHTNNYRILLARCLRLRFLPLLLFFSLGVMIFECYAIYQGLTSDDATFFRTPKEGAPREEGEEGDDASDDDRIDYNLRLDMEDESAPAESASPPTKQSGSCCSCFPQVSEKEKTYRRNRRVGWLGIIVAVYLVGFCVWLYVEQDPKGTTGIIEYFMIFSLAIPSLALFCVHGSYLRQLRASRIQSLMQNANTGGGNANVASLKEDAKFSNGLAPGLLSIGEGHSTHTAQSTPTGEERSGRSTHSVPSGSGRSARAARSGHLVSLDEGRSAHSASSGEGRSARPAGPTARSGQLVTLGEGSSAHSASSGKGYSARSTQLAPSSEGQSAHSAREGRSAHSAQNAKGHSAHSGEGRSGHTASEGRSAHSAKVVDGYSGHTGHSSSSASASSTLEEKRRRKRQLELRATEKSIAEE